VAIFSVLYPSSKTKKFDHAYYDSTHIPLVRAAFKDTGLVGVLVLKGEPSADGTPPPFVAMAHFAFESPEALQASITGPRAAEVFADVKAFTTIKPVTQVSQRAPSRPAEPVVEASAEH